MLIKVKLAKDWERFKKGDEVWINYHSIQTAFIKPEEPKPTRMVTHLVLMRDGFVEELDVEDHPDAINRIYQKLMNLA